MARVTITKKQMSKYTKIGNDLIKKNLTTGFQIEDFNPKQKKRRIQYGHDTKSHLNIVQKNVGGKRFPRESYYKWDSKWSTGENTKLLFNKTLAHEKGEYLTTNNINKADKYFRNHTIKGKKKAIKGSWDVPDVRLFGTNNSNYKPAYQITKNIDHNSRLLILVSKKKKMQEIRKKLKGEIVKRIKVQNYKKHSFHNFIS